MMINMISINRRFIITIILINILINACSALFNPFYYYYGGNYYRNNPYESRDTRAS